MFDFYISDEKAYELSFGKLPSNPRLPNKPELIWGDKNDSTSNYPKCYMDRVLRQYNKESSRETFRDIVKNIDIRTLEEKCPISFEKFVEDIKQII